MDFQYLFLWTSRNVLPILLLISVATSQISQESHVKKGRFFADDAALMCRKSINLQKPSQLTFAAACLRHEYCPDQCEGFKYDVQLSVCQLCLSCLMGDPEPSTISSHHFRTDHNVKKGEFNHCHCLQYCQGSQPMKVKFYVCNVGNTLKCFVCWFMNGL